MAKLRAGTRKILGAVNARKDLAQSRQGRHALAQRLKAMPKTLRKAAYKSGRIAQGGHGY